MQANPVPISRTAGVWHHAVTRCMKVLLPAAAVLSMNAMAAITEFSATGINPSDITAKRDDFRSAIGGGVTPGANGDFGGVRREINWDGVPAAFSDPALLPGNFFNANSPRGAVFSTTGTGFLVSANSGGSTPTVFGFPGDLQPFSAQKLFGVVGSRTMDIQFFIPGTNTAATTSAFGAIFVDVENNDPPGGDFTSMKFFDQNNVEIFSSTVLATNTTKSLSFLGGVANAGERIARVTITTPNNFLLSNGVRSNELNDFVIMDDFIYATPVPEPEIWAMVLLGLGMVGWRSRKRA